MSKYDYQEDPKDARSDAQADVIMAILLGAWLFFAFIRPMLIHFNVL